MINVDDAKGLIFDCDGTLVDSMPLHMEAWKHAFHAVDAQYNHAYLDSKRGMKESDIVNLYNKDFNKNLNADKIIKIKHEYFNNHLRYLKPIQQITDIVTKYYRKLPMGLVSGSLREIVHKELEIINPQRKGENIISGYLLCNSCHLHYPIREGIVNFVNSKILKKSDN